MSYASPTKTITIGTMRRWKSGYGATRRRG